MAHVLLRSACRTGLLRQQSTIFKKCVVPMGTEQAYDEMKDFWAKNRQLNRPLSPHLSIYSPQLTSMLSLCHRATGIMMAVTVPAVAGALMFMPHDFTTYINMIHSASYGNAVITSAKYVLAFPVIYHYINGIRHLAWDWATGFSLKATYNSGYFVLALSLVSTAAAVHLL